MSHRHLAPLIAFLAWTPALGHGQQADPNALPAAVLDTAAEKALWAWEALEYRPVEVGLRGGSFKVRMHLTGRGEQKGTANYRWRSEGDVRESSLEWDPASLGVQLSREGWSKERFDAEYLHLDGRLPYAGCNLVGHFEEEGAVWIEIRGNSQSGIKELHFDREGVLARQVYEVDSGFGSKMRFSLRPRFQRLEDGRFVKIGERFEMKAPFGAIQSESTIELQQIDGVFVPKTMKETSTFNGEDSGENTFEYLEWKIERAGKEDEGRMGRRDARDEFTRVLEPVPGGRRVPGVQCQAPRHPVDLRQVQSDPVPGWTRPHQRLEALQSPLARIVPPGAPGFLVVQRRIG